MRRAERADLAAIESLWRSLIASHGELDPVFRVSGDAVPARVLARLIGQPGVAAWVGVVDAQVTGFCVTRIETAPAEVAEASRAEISELFVAEDARRHGLGRALVETACDWARERGVVRIEVRVAARNAAGQAFWRSLGFGAFVDVLDRRL